MADSRLRKLQRIWMDSGSIEDEASYRKEQLRTGVLNYDRAIIGSRAGHPALRLICETSLITNWLDPSIAIIEKDHDLFLLIAIAACRHYRRFWNLLIDPEDPVAWVERLGGKTHYWTDDENHQVQLYMKLDGKQVNSSVPFNRLRTTYPGFNNERHWREMLRLIRRQHFDKGKDYIMEPLVWQIVDIIESYRHGKIKQEQLLGYGTLVSGQVGRTNARFIEFLWGMTQSRFEDHYRVCLTECLSAKGTHEAINKGVIEWALT